MRYLYDEIVAVRIAWQETDLRDRAKRLGAVWRPAQKVWEMSWESAKRLSIADRVGQTDKWDSIHIRIHAGIYHHPSVDVCIYP